jgi:ankyrin repeat protein
MRCVLCTFVYRTAPVMESTSKIEECISTKLAKSLFHRNTSVPSLANEKFLAAAQSGNCDVIRALLASSAVDVNCVDYLGRSALELAVSCLHYGVVELLLPQVREV